MTKPTIATLTATVATLEARVVALEAALAAKPAAAPAPAVSSRVDDSLTLADLAKAIADGTAITCLDRNRLSFRVGKARWRLKELPAGQTPQAAANRLRAHVVAGGRLQAPRWERIS